MSDEPTLRSFEPGDYPAAHALWSRTEGMGLGESDDRQSVLAFLARNPGLSLVAEFRGELVAAVLCGHDGRRGYLHHLAVEKAWRRKGLAKAMVGLCLEKLAGQGIPKCNLFLYRSNEQGAAFWKHLGWSAREDLVMIQTQSRKGSCEE